MKESRPGTPGREEQESGRTQGALANPGNTDLAKQRNYRSEEGGGKNGLFSLVEQRLSETLTRTPAGEDPAFWPIPVLNDINYLIVNRQYIKDNLGGGAQAAFAEKVAPMRETVRRVTIAYEILAYPHCRQKGRRECIEAELERDRQMFARDHVELSDAERVMLGKLAAARDIPFNSQKRVYGYAEVPISPHVDPFGKRHMTTDEIRKDLAEQPLEGVFEPRGHIGR